MTTPSQPVGAGFRHEALLYAGADDFVARAAPLIARAVDAGRPVLVAVDAAKIDMLRDQLGATEREVLWKDIRGIGGNPARIIPIWRQFVAHHRLRGHLLGFGEPVWAGRSPAELVEAQLHEQLLDVAFDGDPPFTLLCPYDTRDLAPEVIREAERSHSHGGDVKDVALDGPLAAPPERPAELLLDGASPAGLHRFLADHVPGLDMVRCDDLALAVTAVAGTMGRPDARSRLRVWREPGTTVAELGGLVPVADPLVGREWPAPTDWARRGLWLANQLSDLVQLRSGPGGALVRLHFND